MSEFQNAPHNFRHCNIRIIVVIIDIIIIITDCCCKAACLLFLTNPETLQLHFFGVYAGSVTSLELLATILEHGVQFS